MMKKIVLTALFFTSIAAFPQSGRVDAAFRQIDSVFKGGSFNFHIMDFDFPSDVVRILLKFNNAIAANKDWFEGYSRNAPSGQPLPYDDKFGITREEYGKIRNMDQLHPDLKVVDSQNITLFHQDGKISFRGEGQGRVLDYLEFYPAARTVVFAGDTIPLMAAINITFASAYGLSTGYTWRLQKTDVNKSLQANQLTARVIEIDLGIRQPGNKLLLRIQYQDMENGVSRANLDLAGYIDL
jgi:hypothetical protein